MTERTRSERRRRADLDPLTRSDSTSVDAVLVEVEAGLGDPDAHPRQSVDPAWDESTPTGLAPMTAFDRFSQAQEAESDGDLRGARRLYREAARAGGFEAEGFRACGRVERRMGELLDAVRSLTMALHGCEEDVGLTGELYTEIGDIFAQLENYDEAAYYYRRALRFLPGDASVQRRLNSASGLALLQSGSVRCDSAEAWLDQTG